MIYASKLVQSFSVWFCKSREPLLAALDSTGCYRLLYYYWPLIERPIKTYFSRRRFYNHLTRCCVNQSCNEYWLFMFQFFFLRIGISLLSKSSRPDYSDSKKKTSNLQFSFRWIMKLYALLRIVTNTSYGFEEMKTICKPNWHTSAYCDSSLNQYKLWVLHFITLKLWATKSSRLPKQMMAYLGHF